MTQIGYTMYDLRESYFTQIYRETGRRTFVEAIYSISIQVKQWQSFLFKQKTLPQPRERSLESRVLKFCCVIETVLSCSKIALVMLYGCELGIKLDAGSVMRLITY